MKITKVGKLIISADTFVVEDFQFDPEEKEMQYDQETFNSVCAETVARWALGLLQSEVQRAQLEALKRLMGQQKEN